MKLTEAERWILMNQYEILALLDPSQKKDCDDAVEALQEGYELHYGQFANITPAREVLSPAICEEVIAILNMYRAITFSYKNLADKAGISQDDIAFTGFDGNEEPKLYSYTQWFLNLGHGRFQELNAANDCNSHTPMMDTYRSMMAVWEGLGKPRELSKEQIQELIKAGFPYR